MLKVSPPPNKPAKPDFFDDSQSHSEFGHSSGHIGGGITAADQPRARQGHLFSSVAINSG
jgi:hypothetical protein